MLKNWHRKRYKIIKYSDKSKRMHRYQHTLMFISHPRIDFSRSASVPSPQGVIEMFTSLWSVISFSCFQSKVVLFSSILSHIKIDSSTLTTVTGTQNILWNVVWNRHDEVSRGLIFLNREQQTKDLNGWAHVWVKHHPGLAQTFWGNIYHS